MSITSYHKWHSPALGRDMELKVFGHGGKAVLIFPSSGGRFYEYEDFGMAEACRHFTDSEKITLFTVDSVDSESLLNFGIHPSERIRKHEAYERYIIEEVAPFIRNRCPQYERFMTAGCSLGAYHAANFIFRHPDAADAVIALSGLYGPNYLMKGYSDDQTYFHFPLLYLPNLNDKWYIDRFRQSQLIFCVGQGAWERCSEYDCIGETQALKEILDAKNIPCTADFWGNDVSHDWIWWRVQMPYFLGKLN